MRNWLVVATFFCLWLSTQFRPSIQDFLAYGLILTFGILHGANDIFLARKLGPNKDSFTKILIPYIIVIGIVSLVFIVSKTLALVLFIIISAYHFGEQHFNSSIKERGYLKRVLFLSYGFLILFMIFYFKLDKVELIIYEITNVYLYREFYLIGLVSSSLVFFLLFFIMLKRRLLVVDVFRELMMFLAFLVVFNIASLSWAFAIYFILWHSIPSLNDQMLFLYGDSSSRSFLKYLKTSWLYWGVSILGLVLLYFLLKDRVEYFVTILLYVLAAVTFPHVIVMSKVEHSKSSP